jgi:hypothetical protein
LSLQTNILSTSQGIAEEYYQLNNVVDKEGQINKKIFIINPVLEGQGDLALANKIAKLIPTQASQVMVKSFQVMYRSNGELITAKELEERKKYRCDPEQSSGSIDKAKSDLIVITPFSFSDPKRLANFVKENFFIHKDMKIVMIDEMAASAEFSLPNYVKHFRNIGVQQPIEEKRLGFDKGSRFKQGGIGYLALEEAECIAIEQRAKIELEKLFDSFSLNIDPSAYYYVGYLSTSLPRSSSYAFIINILGEICKMKERPSSMNFIFVFHKSTRNFKKEFADLGKLLSKTHKSIADKFLTLNLFLINSNQKKNYVSHCCLQNFSGDIPINIIIPDEILPKNIWHDFIYLSKSGIMTGDQSLSDYLSIKKNLPFYEVRGFKKPLQASIIKYAETFGDQKLKEYIESKFIDKKLEDDDFLKIFNTPLLNDELKLKVQDFDRALSQRTANDELKKYFNIVLA